MKFSYFPTGAPKFSGTLGMNVKVRGTILNNAIYSTYIYVHHTAISLLFVTYYIQITGLVEQPYCSTEQAKYSIYVLNSTTGSHKSESIIFYILTNHNTFVKSNLNTTYGYTCNHAHIDVHFYYQYPTHYSCSKLNFTRSKLMIDIILIKKIIFKINQNKILTHTHTICTCKHTCVYIYYIRVYTIY